MTSPAPAQEHSHTGSLGFSLTQFTAAAGMIAPVVILIAALVAVGAYLAFDQQAVGSGRALLLAAAAIGLAWLGSALLLTTRGRPETATPRAYLNLLNLSAEIEDAINRIEVASPSEADRAILLRMRDQLQAVRATLGIDEPGAPPQAVAISGRVDWLRSAGYNECYKRLHAIQADLLLICGRAELLSVIHEDYVALTDSRVPGADTLQYHLERSVAALGLNPATFFARPKTRVAASVAEDLATVHEDKPVDTPPSEEIRFRVRSVRIALDAFRDRTFEGLIHQRDRARASTSAAGAILYVVLVWMLLFDIKHETLLYASVLFAVGATVGVFARLLIQSEVGSDVEDYGLYMARVAQTVVASGVAALIGVVVTVYGVAAINNSDVIPAPTTPAALETPTPVSPSGTPTPVGTSEAEPAGADGSANDVRLASVFDFETYPIAVVLAAIFGLSPTLLLKRLEDATTRLKLDIKSIQSSEGHPAPS